MTVGNELKNARDSAGLSIEDISERTKIQLYKLEALERGTFELLPQGIYLEGIVRAYAHELGIPHEPLIERVRLERGTLPGDWPVPFAATIELHPKASDSGDDRLPQNIHILDDFQGSDPLDSFTTELDSFTTESDFAREPDFTREPVTSREQQQLPPPVAMQGRQTRQRSGLTLPLLALLTAIGLGMFFYRVKPSLESDARSVAVESEARPAGQTDTAVGTSGDVRESQPSGMNSSAVPQDTPGTFDTTASSAPRVSKTAPPATKTVPSATRTAPPAAKSVSNVTAAGSVPNVSGAWTLATRVESSSLARFQGLQLGYEMRLKQDGERVTGVGRKVTENGAGIRRRAQTPLTVNGTIEGDRLMLTFVERGTRRPTQGKFVLLMDERGTLRGSFSSSAARSSGSVEARRLSTQ